MFNENLNIVYKEIYRLVKHLGFSGEYVETLTPAERIIYWQYFVEENKSKEESSDSFNVLSDNLPMDQEFLNGGTN